MKLKKLRTGKRKVLMMIAALLACSMLGACSDVGDAAGTAGTGSVKERGAQTQGEAQTHDRAEAEEATDAVEAPDGNGSIEVIILPDDDAGDAEGGRDADAVSEENDAKTSSSILTPSGPRCHS